MAYRYTGRQDCEQAGHETGYDRSYSRGYDYGYGLRRIVDAKKALQPLFNHIAEYDALRRRLETLGGAIGDLDGVTGVLSRQFVLKGNCRDCKVSLTDQPALRNALYDIGRGDIHMDVRQLPTAMPVYYLCRVRHDYWSAYSLIVEDLYRSAGYPMLDERFVRLMDGGHETYYLRLSQFRKDVRSRREESDGAPDWEIDDILYTAGRHVFQAAWHEDQRPGVLTATHFGLPHFRQAIELLYLCLSGELCDLRNATDESLLAFFEHTCPQPAIHAFLRMLVGLDGAAINDLPRRALKLYSRLTGAFSRFLSVEVAWGNRRAMMPLYRLAFANFSRLDMVAKGLRDDPHVRDAAARLEQDSQSIVGEIVGH